MKCNSKKTLILIYPILFIMLNIVNGQYPPKTFYKTIAPPAGAAAPGYLSTYDDNTTSTRMLKITQEGGVTHSYAKKQPWNIDGTKYKLRSVAVYDANTHAFYKTLGGLDIYESFWSNTNPDIIYGFTVEGKIRRYNVETEVLELLYDLNGGAEIYELVKPGPGEGNIDIHDKYVALVGHVKNTTDLEIIVFDLQLQQVVTTKLLEGVWGNGGNAPQYIDWVSVSQSGNYVGVMWNHNETSEGSPFVDQDGASHYGVEVYNTTNLNYLRRIVKYGNHGDFGFTPNGEEVFAQFWGYIPDEAGSVFSYLLDGSRVDIIHTDEIFTTNGNHLSCRNILRPGWAYINTDNIDNGHARMLAVKLDGSELIESFGHSFESSTTYDTYSFPCPNPDGTKLMFKSNFGDDSSPNKVCSYEAYPMPFTPSKSLLFNNDVSRDEYVVARDDNSFVTGTEWTMEAWVNFDNFDATGGEDHIMRLGAQLFVDGNNNLKVKAGGNYVSGATVLNTGVWYHVAYVRTTTEVKLYLNGVSEIVAAGADAGSSNKFLLGSYSNPSTQYNFAGKMDEVRLWDVARTAAEINSTKDIELTGTEDDLIVYYNFNVGGGDALVDRTGGDNHGVLNNMEVSDWFTETSPAPVELTSFTAFNSGDGVVLNWKTATEVNNSGFDIEASNDFSAWIRIGFVQGHGNSNSPNSYSFTTTSGTTYFRLKQIDLNGGFEYSDVVKVENNLSYKLFQNYPNPFNPTSNIEYQISKDALVNLTVYNSLGQVVKELVNEVQEAGKYSFQFDGSGLSSGIYFYKLHTNNRVDVKKMLLIK